MPLHASHSDNFWGVAKEQHLMIKDGIYNNNEHLHKDFNKLRHVKSFQAIYMYAYKPSSHLQASPSAIHITDDPLLNKSHTYDGSPVPLKPS